MNFENVKQTAERLGVTTRTIQKWAKAGKLPGAVKMGREWLIPVDFTGFVEEDKKEVQGMLLPLSTAAFTPGHALLCIGNIKNPAEKALALCEYYYYQGEFEEAVRYLDMAEENRDDNIKNAAAFLGVFVNAALNRIHVAHLSAKVFKKHLDELLSEEADLRIVAPAILLIHTLKMKFHLDASEVPVVNKYLRYLPTDGMKMYGCYLMAYKAYLEKDYSRATGICETALSCFSGEYPLARIHINIIASMALINLKKPKEAIRRIEKAYELAMADGFLMPFAEHYELLQGTAEAYFKRKHPDVLKYIVDLTERNNRGWFAIHKNRTGRQTTDILTPKEFTIAMLYSRDWKIKEIAELLDVSERTVKNYIQVIYEKLYINSRKELDKYMLS